MTAASFDPIAYQAMKSDRRTHQLSQLDTICSLPAGAQADALFAVWPERLPRVVRSKVDTDLLKGWRALREKRHDERWEALHDMLDEEGDQLSDDERAEQIDYLLLQKYGDEAEKICALVETLSDLKFITAAITVPTHPDQEPMLLDLECEGLDQEELRFNLMLLFVRSLHFSAGIQIRQTLPLRTQVKNRSGEMEWVHQERVYGIVTLQGEWAPITEQEVKRAYNHDHEDGSVLPKDPITSFGTLWPAYKKMMGKG